MFGVFACITCSIRNNRTLLDEDNFKDCPTIVDRELKGRYKEITLKAGECREVSYYSYAFGSESDISVDLYKLSDLTKPIKTVKNPLFYNNPMMGPDEKYTATLKCTDSTKECKVQLKTEGFPSFAGDNEGTMIDGRIYLTSIKSGKIEVNLKPEVRVYPVLLNNNTIKIVGEPKDKVQIFNVADEPDDKTRSPNEITITAPGTAFSGLNIGEKEAKATFTYESTKEGNKLWFPEFAGWIPQRADLFTLDDLKNEAPSNGKIGAAAIAGIAIGVIVVVGIIVGVLVWLFVFKAKKEDNADAP
ncbi:hypothetical protein TVAG_483970 [Trichomonas vaginalis G3]|uniref:Uncharacterized protein n=1 Tax=Trichomonas vaginalis (strain ATCC PRA-98 / G3) TaxID=412133 RepID=A2EA40_TRIV3|nr:glycoprotein 38 family [Trichomonas vaginalis G3]EAY10486.1 hypothetical protein TVAG_483970 [Trichomonas vaginalis G3]KAI5489286.1 glycoprotein 38 family [Trichomonas vaginalis G3]|eukprot:XP_001322709.1 hypothetical protein [Trichomonas vaginalis G3]